MLSYLSRFATRAPSARVDERTRLNLPGYHGDASVRVYVEDTGGRRGDVEPRIRLKISDCDTRISLWFELDTPGDRRNALHKIATLLDALHRFEDALHAEAELAARRSPTH
ncbi:MAG TPA: hypothetical protein VN238_01210 [Solirubrobacteraceae bacterium]|nr:hypothetical protein [Solirubrobacteraceae bacterium]